MKKFCVFIASGFGIGLVAPFAPGTFGSLPGVALAYATTALPLWLQIPVCTAFALLAIPFCEVAEKALGIKDDGRITADEWMLFPIALVGIPLAALPWWSMIVFFCVVRAVDILKPWPARGLQSIPGGRGIVIDDFVANLYSLAINWIVVLTLFSADAKPVAADAEPVEADVVVYGATPAGIAASIAAKREGRSVVLLEPTDRIGGLTAGGLGQTDCGDVRIFRGISREFYERIKAHYAQDSAWTREKRSDYKGYPWGRVPKGDSGMWTFEPSVAEKVLKDWLAEYGIAPVLCERIRLPAGGAVTEGGRIVALVAESGRTYRGKVFVDASYEGDLMASAGVPYRVGREGNDAFGEAVNGVATGYCRTNVCNHTLMKGIDPYVVKGDPSSGLLPGVEPDDATPDGTADGRLQAYNFRLCLTDVPENRIPFAKPSGYDERAYELLFRNFEAGETRVPWLNSPMPNRKTDVNSAYGVSTDLLGANYGWPEGDWTVRAKIYAEHVLWTEGLLWTLANHPRVPEKVRAEVSRWGWCRDEYVGAKNRLGALYVREARRLKGVYTMTEADCLNRRATPHPVAAGNYTIDSHHVRRIATKDGVMNEGNVQVFGVKPYPISYDALVPERSACTNLIVPVCLSATHTSFGSIRMEPVYFSLGEAAGKAASLAVVRACAVQDAVPFSGNAHGRPEMIQ